FPDGIFFGNYENNDDLADSSGILKFIDRHVSLATCDDIEKAKKHIRLADEGEALLSKLNDKGLVVYGDRFSFTYNQMKLIDEEDFLVHFNKVFSEIADASKLPYSFYFCHDKNKIIYKPLGKGKVLEGENQLDSIFFELSHGIKPDDEFVRMPSGEIYRIYSPEDYALDRMGVVPVANADGRKLNYTDFESFDDRDDFHDYDDYDNFAENGEGCGWIHNFDSYVIFSIGT
ncbi:MAG: hypothetical protein GOV00_03115, partial [Candidatus Altiarchaeota archaeon]|nr:hypothetical protein [Candidatus Altiarchaeota archaeon]